MNKEEYKKTDLGYLPLDWNTKRIEDICEILDSKRIPLNKEQRDNMKGDIPYYGANGVVDYINDYLFDEDLILMAEDGGYFDEYRTRHIAYKVKGKSWVNNHAHVLKVLDSQTYEFIYYTLVHKNILPFINGGTRAKLNQADLKKILIQYPPLKEQQKIAEILSSVDAAIEKTEQVIAKTEEVKKGLMQQILTKGIGHTEFKQTEIGEIPVGWNVINLEEICSLITYGFTNPMPTTDEGPYMITAKDIRDGDIQYKTARKTSMECYSNDLTDKSRPSIGDILITKDGTLGRLAIVKQEDICINQSVARIVLKDINLVKYIYYLLDSPQVQTRILAESGGSTIKHIYITKLAKTLIPISTDVEEIKNITNILDSYDYKISSEKRKCNYLINIKKGLMQQLLTGQVRVKID